MSDLSRPTRLKERRDEPQNAMASKMPDYALFNGPIHRPHSHCNGLQKREREFLWDMMSGNHGRPLASGLPRVRRRQAQTPLWEHGWHYPVRPIIAAHRIPWTTQKLRKLP